MIANASLRFAAAAARRDDRVAVTVEHGQPLAGLSHCEAPATIGPLRDRTTARSQAALPGVADRVYVEEILVIAAEPHHPAGELDGSGDPGFAHAHVQIQERTYEITDQPVGVVSTEDHFDDAPDRALQQENEILRWLPFRG